MIRGLILLLYRVDVCGVSIEKMYEDAILKNMICIQH